MIDASSITDERMLELIGSARRYTVCLLRRGPRWGIADWESLIWEHGRRNIAMREAGMLVVTLPVPDSEEFAGVGVYTSDAATVREILVGDPAIAAGVLEFELLDAQGFPGDALPDPTVTEPETAAPTRR